MQTLQFSFFVCDLKSIELRFAMSDSSDVDCYVVFDHDMPLYDGCEYLQGPLFYVNHGFKCTLKDGQSVWELTKLKIPGWKYDWSFVIFAVMPSTLITKTRTSMFVCDRLNILFECSFEPKFRYYTSSQPHAFFLVKFFETKEKNRYLYNENTIYLSIMQYDYETQKLSYIRSVDWFVKNSFGSLCKHRSVYYIPTSSMTSMSCSDTSFHILRPWRECYECVDLDILTDNRKTNLKRKRPLLESDNCIILESNKQRKTYDEKQIVHSDNFLPFLDFREYLESMNYMLPLIMEPYHHKRKTRVLIDYIHTELQIHDTLFDWTFNFFHRRNPSFFEISLLNNLVYCSDITDMQPYSLLEWLPYDCIFRLTCQLSHFIF